VLQVEKKNITGVHLKTKQWHSHITVRQYKLLSFETRLIIGD